MTIEDIYNEVKAMRTESTDRHLEVVQRLTAVETKVKPLAAHLEDVQEELDNKADQADLDDVQEEVAELQKFKARAVGISTALAVFGGLLGDVVKQKLFGV